MSRPSSRRQPFVLVTGATGGVGRRLVERLAKDRFHVLAAVRDPSTFGQTNPGSVTPIALDLADRVSIQAASAVASRLAGRAGLAGLFNVAGVIAEGPLEVVDPEDFRRQLDINVFGPFALTQALLPLLRAGRGRVVNIGAATARTTVPFFGAISASKAALASLSDAMRMEFAPFGVQVALIEPGALKTGIFDRSAGQLEVTLQRRPEMARFYRPAIAAMQAANRKAGADEPEVVVEAAITALTAPRAKPRQLVGKGAGTLQTLSRLPTGLRDGMLMRSLGIAKAMKASLKVHPSGPAAVGGA